MDWFLYDNGLRHVRVKMIILVVGASDRFLGASYGFLYKKVRLNVPEFPLNKNPNHSNDVQNTSSL